MVEIVENSTKLILKLSHTLSVASDYGEFFSEKVNVDVKKIETKYDMNIAETTYEVMPLSDDAKLTVTIRDDNPYDLSYHHDFVYFRFNGEKWEIEDRFNPNYH